MKRMGVKVEHIQMSASLTLDDEQWALLALFMDSYSATISTMVKEVPSRYGHREAELRALFESINEQTAAARERFKATRDVFEGRSTASRRTS